MREILPFSDVPEDKVNAIEEVLREMKVEKPLI